MNAKSRVSLCILTDRVVLRASTVHISSNQKGILRNLDRAQQEPGDTVVCSTFDTTVLTISTCASGCHWVGFLGVAKSSIFDLASTREIDNL